MDETLDISPERALSRSKYLWIGGASLVVILAIVGYLIYSAINPSDTGPDSVTGSGTTDTQPGDQEDHGFTISATVDAKLIPSATAPVVLVLVNPGSVPMFITGLTVEVRDVTAKDGGDIDCDRRQFTIRQFSGSYGFSLAASHTSSLADLGIAAAQWPQITMVNAETNQDGCKNALVKLRLAGTASSDAP